MHKMPDMMSTFPSTVLIVGASSGIGSYLGAYYRENGANVVSTSCSDPKMLHLDINNPQAIEHFRSELIEKQIRLDLVVVSVGILEPIGPFFESSFAVWENSYRINSVAQWQLIHALRPLQNDDATVIFFAGGAVNGVLENYSSYAVAKIGLIKMAEYLQAEDPGIRYAVVGPGWVATKIHEQTLQAGARAGNNLERTKLFMENAVGTRLEDIAQCIEWIRAQPIRYVGGRNYSVVHDAWGERPGCKELEHALKHDTNAFKLRRSNP